MANINTGIAHRFLDEVGDTAFFGKGKVPIIGTNGVSNCFGIGIVRIDRPLDRVRAEIAKMHREIENDAFVNTLPSVRKRVERGGFFFHACKDSPEIRQIFFKYLDTLPCEADVVMARKSPARFSKKHNGKADEFYAEVLAHTIKRMLKKEQKLVLNIAERGSSTRAKVLDSALANAMCMAAKKWGEDEVKTKAVFNIQSPLLDQLLCVADYLCWAVQRVFELGDTRFYDYLREKRIRLVVDLYDREKYAGSQNYYDGKRNPLTSANKIGPQTT